ncbi:unnamed protein product [Orchesella dallaii]|uniref:Gustatory receptor n=1 Tax=Orchesella dallaii TaxID=48710 RepID=A0ABP1PR58_9HEXA
MSGRSSKLDDIVLTTFDNDKIFVVHPKTRRRSSTPTCLTIETDLGESSSNISNEEDREDSENEIFDAVGDQAITEVNDAIYQPPEGHTVIDLDSYALESLAQDTSHEANPLKIGCCWNRQEIEAYFTNLGEGSFNWTIIQTWYNLAFTHCLVPFFIRMNRETTQYEKVSFLPQQVLWTISMILLIFEMISWIPPFLAGLEEEPNPYTYLNMAGVVTGFLLRCCFIKLVCCQKQIIEFLNKSKKLLEMLPVDRQWFEDGSPLHSTDVLYSILGLATYASGLLSFSNAVLCLVSCTSTLLLSAMSLRHATTITTVEKFELLNDMSNRLSNIVGGLLTLYMVNFAVAIPELIRFAFQNHKIFAVFLSFHVCLLLTFAIDRIKSELTEPDGISQLPNDLKYFIGMFLKIFQTSVGIGYPGLYVLTFRLLFSYMGIVCSVIVVIHETVKDMKN